MSLAHRIIPTILCRGRALVKGVGFDSWRSVGLAAQAVRIHQARGVDEVVLLDIAATKEGRGPDLGLVEELAEIMFAPLAVGGGVRTLGDVRALLRAGADKVVIGTAAEEKRGLIQEVAAAVGSQAIVASVDVKDYRVHVRSGQVATPWTAETWAGRCCEWGAGEILLQAIERDGSMRGYDIDMIRDVAAAVDVPVIASGGCSGYPDMREAIAAGASAVAAGALFQFTDATPREAATYLHQVGLEVRL